MGGRPAVVAVTARARRQGLAGRRGQPAGQSPGPVRGDLVKGALSGRGGGNADLAQGGGVAESAAADLLTAIEHALLASRSPGLPDQVCFWLAVRVRVSS